MSEEREQQADVDEDADVEAHVKSGRLADPSMPAEDVERDVKSGRGMTDEVSESN